MKQDELTEVMRMIYQQLVLQQNRVPVSKMIADATVTARDQVIQEFLSEGMTYRSIVKLLGVSEATIADAKKSLQSDDNLNNAA